MSDFNEEHTAAAGRPILLNIQGISKKGPFLGDRQRRKDYCISILYENRSHQRNHIADRAKHIPKNIKLKYTKYSEVGCIVR
jgi:hypothetical protein